MDGIYWLLLFMGGLSFGSVAFAFIAPQLGRSARRRRRAKKTPIRRISEAHRDEVIRIRGVVRASGTTLTPPFTAGAAGVFHLTQLSDLSNPGQTSTFTRGKQCEFLIDDGSGRARIPREIAIELVGPEPQSGGVDRNTPEVAEFLGRDVDNLFSKGGAVIWRQRCLRVGDEVLVWGRVVIEPETDAKAHQGHFREEPQRVALAPVDPKGVVVIEPVR